MEPIDLLALNKTSQSHSARNLFTGRLMMLPRCAKWWKIVKGPSLPRICAAPANVLSWEMSKKHGFKHADKRISDRVPVEFTLDPGTSSKDRYASDFSIETVIWSVETYPDREALSWSVFGNRLSEHNADDLSASIALRGSFRAISDSDNVPYYIPESLKGADYKECIIVYNPWNSRGWLGEVAEAQELPSCGLIKDFDILCRVVSKFSGGFIETHAPNGACCWGRLCGGYTSAWISCDATKEKNEEWKYAPSNRDGWSLNLIGVRYVNKENVHWHELVGDAFLCSDGTILHSYYFSRKEWGESPPIPDTWKEGYYSNRLYPLGSPMVPKYITDSFEREMPTWFFKADEARKAKMSKATR